MSQNIRQEVDKNYDAFLQLLPSIIRQHQGKYALMKDGEVVGCYSTLENVYVTTNKFITDEIFSVQKVTGPWGFQNI